MEQAEAYSLSDTDIRTLLGAGIKITSYPSLANCRSINDTFDKRGRAILFVPQSSTASGHWCCLLKKGRSVEFFDPYGEQPDDQKDTIPKSLLEKMRMDKPMLSDLLEDCPYDITYNKVQLQELANGVNTCGRHCVARLLYHSKSLPQYRAIIKDSGLTPDEFVVNLTLPDLGK